MTATRPRLPDGEGPAGVIEVRHGNPVGGRAEDRSIAAFCAIDAADDAA
jgi:hypothetical protein